MTQYLDILIENGIKINPNTKWTEEVKDKIYSSNALEMIHIHPDKIKYWEDIRCGIVFKTIILPHQTKNNLFKC